MDERVVPDHSYSSSQQQLPHDDERGVNAAPAGLWPVDEDIFFDWDALYGPQDPNLHLGSQQGEWPAWSVLDGLHLADRSTPLFGGEKERAFDGAGITSTLDGSLALDQNRTQTGNTSTRTPIVPSGFNNVAEWLDGAYRPPTPCDHCRRHRLQCLILRRTSDNPNPVPSCSSCVGLFRPCSFGRGEKRQASGFETLSPVLGHLHGVIEEGDEDGSGRKPDTKETKQFVRKGARVLRDWFYRNEECPYPSEEDKARLAQETGFSRQRISTWFANARRRYKQQRQVRSSTRIYRAGSPMPTPMSDVASMTPMERWQASPPDEEPVPEAVIRKAIASTSVASDGSGRSQVDSPSTELSSGCEGSSLASSLSSFGVLGSDASDSSSSAWSFQSGDGPLRSRPFRRRVSAGRRGRKRITEDGHYQCTFCTQSFKKKHDWSRHEKSVHLLLDMWICTPNLSQVEDPSMPLSECRFCNHQSPTREHWESHDFQECATKPLAERSFSRKDYLWQHLRKFHGCTRYPVPHLDAWRSSQSEIQSRCGFCAAHLPSWSGRADHLASHFKEGLRMSQWAGDWGFDAAVLSRLKNAVLPVERGLHVPS